MILLDHSDVLLIIKWLFYNLFVYEVLKVHQQLLVARSATKLGFASLRAPTRPQLNSCFAIGSHSLSLQDSGDEGIRTLDPLLARQVLSQLSYTPKIGYVFILMSGRLLNSDFAFACLR